MFHGQTLKSATSDYDQRHVIAFWPISVAARSWSYDKAECWCVLLFSVVSELHHWRHLVTAVVWAAVLTCYHQTPVTTWRSRSRSLSAMYQGMLHVVNIALVTAFLGDGEVGHWLVQMEWRPARWSVCLPLLIFPCIIKFRSSLLALTHPCGPWKRAVKLLWYVVVTAFHWLCLPSFILAFELKSCHYYCFVHVHCSVSASCIVDFVKVVE